MAVNAYQDIVKLLPRLSAVEKLRLVEHLAIDVERELQEDAVPGAEGAWQRFLAAGEEVARGWKSDQTATELLSSMRR